MDVPHAGNNVTNAPRSNISGNINVDSPTSSPAASSAVTVDVKQDHNAAATATAATAAASSRSPNYHHHHQQHEVGKLIIHGETPTTTTTKKTFFSNPPAFTATASSSSATRNDTVEQSAVSESDTTAAAATAAVVGTTGTTKPSRWRFATNNKARTRSSKYTEPPDVSLYDYDTNNNNTSSRYRKEAPVRPEQTVYQYPFAFKEVKKKKEKEVGKLDIKMTLPNVFQTSEHHEVGKLTIHEVEQEVEELPMGTFEGLLPPPFESTPPNDDDGVVTRKPFREWNTGNTNTIELTPKKQEWTSSEWYDNGRSNDSYKVIPDSINNNNNNKNNGKIMDLAS
mmetsp:Transcript_34382/g.63385  ORF Transcript_34382/g.63385 Transcript_34382/m.63385 type:complete len:339 (-) Transcript_34382:503-1519(-)